jgi:hypothetical protein
LDATKLQIYEDDDLEKVPQTLIRDAPRRPVPPRIGDEVLQGSRPHSAEAAQLAEELVREFCVGRVRTLDRRQRRHSAVPQLLHAHARLSAAGEISSNGGLLRKQKSDKMRQQAAKTSLHSWQKIWYESSASAASALLTVGSTATVLFQRCCIHQETVSYAMIEQQSGTPTKENTKENTGEMGPRAAQC